MKNSRLEKGKLVLQYIFMAIFLLTMAVLLECVVFQFRSVTIKEKPFNVNMQSDNVQVTIEDTLAKLTEEEQESIRINQENERLIAEHYGNEYEPKLEAGLVEKDGELYREVIRTSIQFALKEPYYVKKFDLRVPLEQKGGYTLNITNGEREKTIYCSIDPKIDAGITNVNAYGKEFEIVFLSQEDISVEELTVTLSNTFEFNWYRILIIYVLFLTVAFLFMSRKWLAEKPELVFVCTAFLIGCLIIWGVGTNQVGYDEYSHAKSAYDLSFGSTIETTEAAMQLKGNLLPFFYTPEERELIEQYEQENNDYSWADITHQSRMVRAENRVYYPNALGFKFARLIGADFASSVMLAKLGGLICYIAVMYFAIAMASRYKMLVAFIALLPNNMFMACSLTRDMVVTSFLILGTVLMMNEFLEPEKKLTWQRTLAIILAFVCGSVSKPVYIVMLLLLLFLGKAKFENRLQEVIFKVAICMVAGLMIYDIFYPTPVAGSDHMLVSNFAFAGDKRSTGTSNIGQMQYILGNPLTYTKVLLGSMFGMLFEYLALDSFMNYGYLGNAPMIFNWIGLFIGLCLSLVSPKNEERKVLGKGMIALTALMLFGTISVVWTSMYISYTAVGSSTIEGVQGRYFIPLFVPFFICLFRKNRKSRLDKKLIHRIAFMSIILMNLYMVYTLILNTMNI